MAAVKTTATLEFSATLKLSEVEIRALEALVGYGDDAFIKHFKENLGYSYIRDHEAGLRSFFAAIRRDVNPAMHEIDKIKKDLDEVVKIRIAAQK